MEFRNLIYFGGIPEKNYMKFRWNSVTWNDAGHSKHKWGRV